MSEDEAGRQAPIEVRHAASPVERSLGRGEVSASARSAAPVLVEVWRGPILECAHRGIAAVAGPDGALIDCWGDVDAPILPRSSVKILQAMPLLESGAGRDLRSEQLALACASHSGSARHVALAGAWLESLGLDETALLCGTQTPGDAAERGRLRAAGEPASPLHNNCSGKHVGFLALARHLGGGPAYVERDHPVQRSVADAFAELAESAIDAWAIDGCSAPNFALSVAAIARAAAKIAGAERRLDGARRDAAIALRRAMAAHPFLVAGEDRACTLLMEAAGEGCVVKTGAEGVFMAMAPASGLGFALKIEDGATRGAEAAIAALLARHGALDPAHPTFGRFADAPIYNRRHLECGRIRAKIDVQSKPSRGCGQI